MYATLTVNEFESHGFFSAPTGQMKKSRKKWSPFTEPTRRHRWPAYSSIAAFLTSLSDEKVDTATKKTVELIFDLNKNYRSSPTEAN
jgi:hypothetical protein